MAMSFISTVLFNGNPLMRFDGYFILMDWLRLPNLSTRATAYVRYLVMNRVLGISLVSNSATTPREVSIFTVYGVCAFAYRIFLYTSIVLGVYYRFDKLLGILLALLAFSLFIVRPLIKGAKTVYMQRKEIHPRPSGVFVFALFLCLAVLILVIPLPRTSLYPCYLASAKIQKLTVPLQTTVDQVFIREGTGASKGKLLFTLEASALKVALAQKQIQHQQLRTEVTATSGDEKRRAEARGKEMELRKLQDETTRLSRDLSIAEHGIVAPFDGMVTTLDYRLQTGFGPGEGVVVGEFESPKDCVVYALVPATDLRKFHVGEKVKIWFQLGPGIIVDGSIDEIKPYGEEDLKNLPFSSRLGGELATEARGEELKDAPLEALYQSFGYTSKQ